MDFFEAILLNVQKITHGILGKARHFTLKSETDYTKLPFFNLGTERHFGHSLLIQSESSDF